jgi:hypothetical protein
MIRILIVAVGLIAGIGAAQAFSWNAEKEKLALDQVRRFQAAHKVPAIAVSVTVDGKVVFAAWTPRALLRRAARMSAITSAR